MYRRNQLEIQIFPSTGLACVGAGHILAHTEFKKRVGLSHQKRRICLAPGRRTEASTRYKTKTDEAWVATSKFLPFSFALQVLKCIKQKGQYFDGSQGSQRGNLAVCACMNSDRRAKLLNLQPSIFFPCPNKCAQIALNR